MDKDGEVRAREFFDKVTGHAAGSKLTVAVYFGIEPGASEQFEKGWTEKDARAAEMFFTHPTIEEWRKLWTDGWNLAGVFTEDCFFPVGKLYLVVLEEGFRRVASFQQSQGNNYAKKLLAAQHAGQLQMSPGTVSDVQIGHDDWCEIFRGGMCNCNPTLVQYEGGSDEKRIDRILKSASSFAETVRKKRI
jgi:hypothetical protein